MASPSLGKGPASSELGWIHVYWNSSWKRRYVVVSDGKIQLFSSEKKSRLKKNVGVMGASVHIVGPDSISNYIEKKSNQTSSKFLCQPLPLECYFWETHLVVIQTLKRKMLYLLAMNQRTAKDWEVIIKEADHILSSTSDSQAKHLSYSDGLKRVLSKISLLMRSFHSPKKYDTCKGELTENLKCASGQSEPIQNVYCCKLSTAETLHLDPLWPHLDSLQGCTDFLMSKSLHANGLKRAKSMINHFNGCYQMGDSSLSDEFRLEAWKGTIRRIIKTLIDQLLKVNPSLESCMYNEEHMDQLWLACETWIIGAVHDKIMGACKQMFASEDKKLFETLSRLQKVDSSVFSIPQELEHTVLGDALCQFKQINRFKTPLEKAICIQKTISVIMDVQHKQMACTTLLQDTETHPLCTDDILSYMVLLMVHSKIQSLQANACFMMNFLYTNKDDTVKGELGFHVTNFVAACNYLHSSEIKELMNEIQPWNSSPSFHLNEELAPASSGKRKHFAITTNDIVHSLVFFLACFVSFNFKKHIHECSRPVNSVLTFILLCSGVKPVRGDGKNHGEYLCGINDKLFQQHNHGNISLGEGSDFLLASTYH